MTPRPILPRSPVALLALTIVLAVLAGCGGGGGSGSPSTPTSSPTPTPIRASIGVQDVKGAPITGALVSIGSGPSPLQATSGSDGIALFPSVPNGETTITLSAAGFETSQYTSTRVSGSMSFTMAAAGEWAIALPLVLGSRMLERTADGSMLTFSVDLAVIDGNSASIANLAASAFQVQGIDCGWGGPRDCASDAEGQAAGRGYFDPDGGALSFGLQPPPARRPFVATVLAERSADISDWQFKLPALKAFFSSLGGNDAANLSSVQVINGVSVLDVLGPYTRDGRVYLPLIDQLPLLGGSSPTLSDSISESIRRVAAARDTVVNGAQPMVLMLSRAGLTPQEFTTLGALARQSGVQFNVVDPGASYGLTELAARTGGFVAPYKDPRQLSILAGALDSLLAGSQPFYRMSFRIKGPAGTFVAGGNAKVFVKVSVPTSIPTYGAFAQFDVPIP